MILQVLSSHRWGSWLWTWTAQCVTFPLSQKILLDSAALDPDNFITNVSTPSITSVLYFYSLTTKSFLSSSFPRVSLWPTALWCPVGYQIQWPCHLFIVLNPSCLISCFTWLRPFVRVNYNDHFLRYSYKFNACPFLHCTYLENASQWIQLYLLCTCVRAAKCDRILWSYFTFLNDNLPAVLLISLFCESARRSLPISLSFSILKFLFSFLKLN